MKPKVYIDGKEGTTGLQIYDRLAQRSDIELLLIDEDGDFNIILAKDHLSDVVYDTVTIRPEQCSIHILFLFQCNYYPRQKVNLQMK